jgi:tRNA (guanine37-N1)-methyltransferase
MIRFDILSIFPEMFNSPFESSIIKKARDKGLVEINLLNIRDFTEDKHRMTDDAPYGGGGGMVMKVEPIDRAIAGITPKSGRALTVLMTPQGERLNQTIAEDLSHYEQIIVICGHYEGVDERVRQNLADREISIGDYVLTGGELSAMVLVDAVSRLIPGVLGNSESATIDSFSSGLLEYPHYTRPSEYRGWKVPEVLLSGHHREIEEWRRKESLKRTKIRRPDMLKAAQVSDADLEILRKLESDE